MSKPRSSLQILLAGALLLLAGVPAAGAQPESLPGSPYARLFTAMTRIHYTDRDASNRSRTGSTTLSGPIWQPVRAVSDTVWLWNVTWQFPRFMQTEPAPVPDIRRSIGRHYAASTQATYADSGGGAHRIVFDSGSDVGLGFFRSPPKARSAQQVVVAEHYDFYCPAELTLEVRGVAVWIAPRGIRFDSRVTIKKAVGSSTAPTLIVVTEPNGTDLNFGDYRDVGVWFFDQGVRVEDNVRVIIVSSGHVRLEIASVSGSSGGGGDVGRADPPGSVGALNFVMPFLTIFSDKITMMGPRSRDGEMFLAHPASMDSSIEHLVELGALPLALGPPVGVGTRELATTLSVGPSPARGSIRFGLPANATGDELEILDIAGRRVWRMAVPAAAEFVLWNGESATGSVRSGVYFARLRHQGVSTTRKLVWAE